MATDFKKCQRCGTIFQSRGKPYCVDCLDLYDKEFETVRDYIYDHPNANVEQISSETEISSKTIFSFIKEGRITMHHPVLSCKICGKAIASGDTCEQCKANLLSKIQGSLPKREPAMKAKERGKDEMHVLGKRKSK